MNTLDFLTAVWPTRGLYAIARPYTFDTGKRDDQGQRILKTVFPAKAFDTISAAAKHALAQGQHTDTYLCVHSLRDLKTAGLRKQTNTLAARSLFLEIDCGPGKPYATQRDALIALQGFCALAILPLPMVVSSGRGLHLYWRMSREIASPDWQPHEQRLRLLAEYFKLEFDPSRTTDTSSLLRVVGTKHLKNRNQPLDVKMLAESCETDTDDLCNALSDSMAANGVAYVAPKTHSRKAALDPNGLGSNLDEGYNGPPVTVDEIRDACPQVERVVFNRGNVPEPEWYRALGVIHVAEDGYEASHVLFNGHPGYDPNETDNKLAQLEEFGATSCDTMRQTCGASFCDTCKYKADVKSPIGAAIRHKNFKPIALVAPTPALPGLPVKLSPECNPPFPFKRVGAGILQEGGADSEDEDGNKDRIILSYDMFPVEVLERTPTEPMLSRWCVTIPRVGQRLIEVNSHTLSDVRSLATCLANECVMIAPENAPRMRKFMSAYIRELQKMQIANRQYDHLGWTENHTRFIMATEVLNPDGTATPCTLSLQASSVRDVMVKQGSLAKQVSLLQFYNRKIYLPHQFLILCSLGAPLYHMTGLAGGIVNAEGDTGASKSSALMTGAGFWGKPQPGGFTMSGLKEKSTINSRNARFSTLGNLPLFIDEITMMEPDDAKAMALGVSQAGPKSRLDRNGVEQKVRGEDRSSLVIATSNTSLHGLLATNNMAGTAGSMRVFEMHFKKHASMLGPEAKIAADDYLHGILENYGWLGETFIKWVVQNYAAVEARVVAMRRRIDRDINAEGGERFWSGTAAAALVAGEIAFELGLCPFDIETLYNWVVFVHIPRMRGGVSDEYAAFSPVNVLCTFMDSIASDTICVTPVVGQSLLEPNIIIFMPMVIRDLKAHYDLTHHRMWIRRDVFTDYCRQKGRHATQVLDNLRVNGIVQDIMSRRTLGLGTDYARGRSLCFTVDMDHAEIAAPAIKIVQQVKQAGNVIPMRKAKP